MSMNRRGFLKLLGIGAAAAVAPAIVVPERRIWAVGFGASRDVHGALGVESNLALFGIDAKPSMWANTDEGALTHEKLRQAMALREERFVVGRDFGQDTPYVWARYDEATGRVIAEPLSNPSSLLDLERVLWQAEPQTFEAVLDTGPIWTARVVSIDAAEKRITIAGDDREQG